MKAVILAGGYGSRLSEETTLKPKPMVEIGGKPIIWHIMKTYSFYGINDFVILLGYKGYYIKEYFANYFLHQNDVKIDVNDNSIEVLSNSTEPWKVTLLDTGENTMTGGRIKRAQKHIGDQPFMLTYGDGVADINIKDLMRFHQSHGKLLTMTSAQPAGRFGALDIDDKNKVNEFKEKPKGDGSWINAGYFVCEPGIFEYITRGDSTVFEEYPLRNLAMEGEIFTYKHNSFWMPMDTIRDKNVLNDLWINKKALWKTWK
ncbi:glucose-1-phosphate cytidylyltransferase [Akkermansiaceae bacterium]|nr:glucose-1-phosphate cytidylyltransferase [Akkermansiaceae bacterium]